MKIEALDNENVISYVKEDGVEEALVKSFIVCIKIEASRQDSGYFVKMVMKHNTQNQNESFETYEDAEEFLFDICDAIGREKFFYYENKYGNTTAIKKFEAVGMKIDKSHNGDGYVLISKFKDSTPTQPDFFDTIEDARDTRNGYYKSMHTQDH